jgi:NAD-dependent deacetylase
MISAQPNPAHIALAELQKAGYIGTIITQNIDALHSRAGATSVLEVHGSLKTLTCTKCFTQVSSDGIIQEYIENCTIPRCKGCGGILKPDIILYEEQLPVRTWMEAEAACQSCDLMLVAGTSLEVMPSAKLPILALDHGAALVIVNNAETFIDVRADVIIQADVAEILPRLANEVIHG